MDTLHTSTYEKIDHNQLRDWNNQHESEPCKKEYACRILRIQDEYFDNDPLPRIKKQHDDFLKEVLKTRQELIKRGFIKENK